MFVCISMKAWKMTTISKDIGRDDLLIHRGCDERFCSKWMIDNRDGKGYVEKDLRKWTAKFFLYCNNKQVYEQDCITDSHGYAIASIPAKAFEDNLWLTRSNGEWKIVGYGDNGEQEWLAWGYYEMV